MTREKDSSTALTVINILRKLTKEGMIVICSIHQPRSNIFCVFDKVLLLRKGRNVFYGPRRSIAKYFERLGETRALGKMFPECSLLMEDRIDAP